MKHELLNDDEQQLWHAWKTATASVSALLARDLDEGTGLSGADFGVLSRLVDLSNGAGALRQQALADSLEWSKSRLSHQLTRMKERGLIKREPAGAKGFTVTITAAGKQALKKARPVHANAIRTRLFEAIPASSRAAFLKALRAIASSAIDEA